MVVVLEILVEQTTLSRFIFWDLFLVLIQWKWEINSIITCSYRSRPGSGAVLSVNTGAEQLNIRCEVLIAQKKATENPLISVITGISHSHTSQCTHRLTFLSKCSSSSLQYFYLPFKTSQASGFINAAISMLIMPSMLKSLLAACSSESFGFIKAEPPPCCCLVCVTKLRSALSVM